MRPADRFDASYYRRFYSGPRRVHAAREVAALDALATSR